VRSKCPRLAASYACLGPRPLTSAPDLAVNIDVDQLDAPHQRSFQIDRAELSVAQVDGAKLRATQVNAFEARATEIGTEKVRHAHDANGLRRRLSGQ
jgi:hypothetical protein